MSDSPAPDDGRHRGVPAEWHAQSGLLITWPHDIDLWGESLFAAVEDSLRHIIALTAPHQSVIIACNDAELVGRLAIEMGTVQGDLRFLYAPSNDIWARDHGPLSCLRDGHYHFLDFQFNGWGGKYDYQMDNRITVHLEEQCVFQDELVARNFVLEGGSIESDGEGTLLTTASCLLHPKRNPDYQRSEVESYLKRHLNAERLLWLEHGYLAGDDTDGHIDNLARFVSRDHIVYTACEDPGDEHYLALTKMRQELEQFTTADGEAYRLTALPLPEAIYDEDGRRLPASYANFLITNRYVFVPRFGDARDQQAMDCLAQCFPERQIEGVDGRALIHQGGGLHCATMNLFAAVTQ
ncbi:MAG: agmatine deiminase family protein [Pseudomonadota bacterium]